MVLPGFFLFGSPAHAISTTSCAKMVTGNVVRAERSRQVAFPRNVNKSREIYNACRRYRNNPTSAYNYLASRFKVQGAAKQAANPATACYKTVMGRVSTAERNRQVAFARNVNKSREVTNACRQSRNNPTHAYNNIATRYKGPAAAKQAGTNIQACISPAKAKVDSMVRARQIFLPKGTSTGRLASDVCRETKGNPGLVSSVVMNRYGPIATCTNATSGKIAGQINRKQIRLPAGGTAASLASAACKKTRGNQNHAYNDVMTNYGPLSICAADVRASLAGEVRARKVVLPKNAASAYKSSCFKARHNVQAAAAALRKTYGSGPKPTAVTQKPARPMSTLDRFKAAKARLNKDSAKLSSCENNVFSTRSKYIRTKASATDTSKIRLLCKKHKGDPGPVKAALRLPQR